jgi:hypothetical protein
VSTKQEERRELWRQRIAEQESRALPSAGGGGDREHPAAVFDYTPTRERAGPEKFLKTYRGYLQADVYVAYDSFFTYG